MKKTSLLVLVLALLTQFTYAQKASPAEKLGWKLGSQAYTFKNFTFATALDKIKGLGLQYVEGFPGQQIGNGVEGTMDYHMDAAIRQKVKDLLKSKGIKMMAYGVVTGKNEEDWKNIFEFAHAMGIPEITSEAMLKELKRQNFHGLFSIEYEYHWDSSVPEIAKSVEYFNKEAEQLL